MFEDILLLKKIADYFSKAKKSSIAELITEELNNEIANHPEFEEPEYVKDDLQTIFFKYVTVKRRRSEASIRKSHITNSRNLNEVTKNKNAKQKLSILQNSENIINLENQENIDYTREELFVESSDSSILPQRVFNRMSENVVRKSQFFPEMRSTPNHKNNIKVSPNETMLNDQSDNEQTVDGDCSSIIIINQPEHFTQTNETLDMISGSNLNNIIKTYEEEFLTQSQQSAHLSQKYFKRSPTVLDQEANKNGKSTHVDVNNSGDMLSGSIQGEYNHGDLGNCITQDNTNYNRSPSNQDHGSTQSERNVSLQSGNIEGNSCDYITNDQEEPVFNPHSFDHSERNINEHSSDHGQTNIHDSGSDCNQANIHGDNIDCNQTNIHVDNQQPIPHNELQRNTDYPGNCFDGITDSDELFPCHQPTVESQESQVFYPDNEPPLFCSDYGPATGPNTQSPSFHGSENGDNRSDVGDMEHCDEPRKEIAVEYELGDAIVSDAPQKHVAGKKRRNRDEDDEIQIRACKQARYSRGTVDEIVDLDNGEEDLFGTKGTQGTNRSRSSSLSSIEDLPEESIEITQKERVVKPIRKSIIKPLVPFKDDKKMELERRVLMSDGWVLWPRSILSSYFKNYDIDSLNEALSGYEQEQVEIHTDRMQCLDQCLQMMAKSKLIHQCYCSKKKMNFYLKYPTLANYVLEYYEIPGEFYSNTLWVRSLGPKYSRKLGAETAPEIVKTLLNVELEFVDNILQDVLRNLN